MDESAVAVVTMKRLLLPAIALSLSAARSASAETEIGLAAGGATYASSWRGDYGGGVLARFRTRFARVIAGDVQVGESFASVNQRFNTGLSLGITGYVPLRTVHPSARVFVIHQHEEGYSSVENAPLGTLFGIGAGIRHRAGGGLALGAEVPIRRDASLGWNLLAEVSAAYFPDAELGPHAYVGLNLGVGVDAFLR